MKKILLLFCMCSIFTTYSQVKEDINGNLIGPLQKNDFLTIKLFSVKKSIITLPNVKSYKEVLINNYDELTIENNTITLEPYQGVVLKCYLNKLNQRI